VSENDSEYLHLAGEEALRLTLHSPEKDTLKLWLSLVSLLPFCVERVTDESALPDVSTVHEEIVQITTTGLVTASGKEVEIDIIACGTGFETAYVPHL
jgi:hypothetical protein